MFLIAKVGAYAGELREYSPEAGRTLLALGRAVSPYAAGGVVQPGPSFLVGESVTDSVVPRGIAEKIERAARRKAKHGRR